MVKKVVTTTKMVIPDVTAQIFWLKNRRPDRWRDKPQEVEADMSETGVIILPERKRLEDPEAQHE